MSSGYRPEVEVVIEPGVTEGRIDGSGLQLVTLRLERGGVSAHDSANQDAVADSSIAIVSATLTETARVETGLGRSAPDRRRVGLVRSA